MVKFPAPPGDFAEAALPSGRAVLMFGTDPDMRGGIASVVSAIREGGFFDWAHVRYVSTHVEGGGVRKLRRFIAAVFTTLRTLISQRVVLAHAHVSSNGSFWRKATLLWIARRFGVPTIFHLHSGGFDTYASGSTGSALRRWCIRRTLESSTVVIVLSERWAAWARGFAPESRIRIVGNPVQVLADATLPRKAGGDSTDAGRVLYMGLICDAKGSFDLLQAWARFRARVPGWRLLVGGNGEVERFLAQAQSLGISDDVDYLGWVSGAEKERVLSIADVFVLPSYKEGMPVSILEAMVHGAAVIATPVGGVPDMMVNERHGLLVEAGDVGALADSLERMATLPELRKRLAAQAHEHVLASYSTETVLRRLKAIYRETIRPAL